MGVIKRAFCSMKQRMGQNIALTIAYTLFFALTLALLLVYLSMSNQVDSLAKSLGCAVTLRGPGVNMIGHRAGFQDIFEEDALAFVDSPYVESYNMVGRVDNADFEGFLPVIRDENLSIYEYQTKNGKTLGYIGDCTMAPVTPI